MLSPDIFACMCAAYLALGSRGLSALRSAMAAVTHSIRHSMFDALVSILGASVDRSTISLGFTAYSFVQIPEDSSYASLNY